MLMAGPWLASRLVNAAPVNCEQWWNRRSDKSIKQARGFRQFLLRGVEKVRAEWAMICTTHNLLKLFTLANAA